MEYEFDPGKLEKEYTDSRYLKKKYGIQIAIGMEKFFGYLDASSDAYELKGQFSLYMEHKKGNLKEYYSISLDKKKSKWRLLIQMLDEEGNVKIPTENEIEFLKSIKKIRIKELSEHYVEY